MLFYSVHDKFQSLQRNDICGKRGKCSSFYATASTNNSQVTIFYETASKNNSQVTKFYVTAGTNNSKVIIFYAAPRMNNSQVTKLLVACTKNNNTIFYVAPSTNHSQATKFYATASTNKSKYNNAAPSTNNSQLKIVYAASITINNQLIKFYAISKFLTMSTVGNRSYIELQLYCIGGLFVKLFIFYSVVRVQNNIGNCPVKRIKSHSGNIKSGSLI